MTRVIALLIAACALAFGQAPQWRVMEGDDLRWAEPQFDDSSWKPSTGPMASMIRGRVDRWYAGVRWYRSTLDIPPQPNGQQLAIGMGPLDDAYQVFIEGQLAGNFGTWSPVRVIQAPRHRSFPIPQGLIHGGQVHVAVRRFTAQSRSTFAVYNAAGGREHPHLPVIGPAQQIREQEQFHTYRNFDELLVTNLISLLVLLCGLLCLVLYAGQRTHKESLWLGVALFSASAGRLAGILLGLTELVPQNGVIGNVLPLVSLSSGTQFFLLWFIAELAPGGKGPRRFIQAAAVLLALYPVAVLVAHALDSDAVRLAAGPFNPNIGIALAVALGAAGMYWLQRRREASLLSVAAAAQIASSLISQIFIQGRTIALTAFQAGIFLIDTRMVASLVISMAMIVILWRRYRREQARLQGIDQDLAAAREAQELSLGGSLIVTPGFKVETAYRPAQEVGGDFYQVTPIEDGSLLVVIGDVSGKGLRAAMLVAHVIGALSNERKRRPAELLEYLNRALVGRTSGGFVTCCCALFHGDGRVEIANAGHIPAFLNGREVEVDTGLPLGLIADASYTQTTVETGGGALTMLSDGVVEARNGSGELLGFTRTAELTRKAANDVADAAQVFGQEDDITVVAVRRSAA